LTTSETGPQPTPQAQFTLPSWHPGEDLTRLEEEMRAKAAAGKLMDRCEGPFDLPDMQGWGKERAIRAAVLRHLLAANDWTVDARGVRLRGVRIHGHLDLDGVTLRCALRLEDCYLDAGKPLCLDQATASRLALTRCHLAGLTGDMLSARKVDLTGSTLTGPLNLLGADITGQLICRDAKLTGQDTDGYALVGERMKVGGSVFLDGEFTAAGAIRLAGANITGNLYCGGARLTGKESRGYALFGQQMKVGGGVFLNKEFTAAGAITLHSTDITGNLNCGGARLTGKDCGGYALFAQQMKVGGGVFLNKEFTAAGAIWLHSTDITGQLNCSAAKLTGLNDDGCALVGEGMKVGGDVFLDQGFTAAGAITLRSTRAGGSVELRPAALAGSGQVALDAARAQIMGSLVWAPASQVLGQVDLEGATVGHLVDDWAESRPGGFWPSGGQLRLDGFTYDRFGGDQQATVGQRLAWIRSQYPPSSPSKSVDFATQPYEQLAKVYRQAGKDSDARKVAIARRADLRRYGSLTWYRKAGNWFMDKTIKFGYQTWRAVLGLAVVLVAFLVMTFVAQHHHAIVPVSDLAVGMHPPPVATQCTPSYPCFYPLGYAVDVVIPVINVHQAEFWGLNGWGWVAASWAATMLGWAAVTLLAVGYTGLVRQQ
jgi:hypothetical protein